MNVVLLAHALGPSGRGEYFLFVAAVALLARLVDLGMSPSAVVFASRYPGALASIHRRLAASLIGLWLVAASLGALALAIFGRDVGDLPREREWLALAVLPVAMYEQVWVHLMVGIRRVVAMNVVQLCAGLLTLALNVGLVVLLPGGVATAVAIYCGVLLAKTPIMATLAWRASHALETNQPVPGMREILSFSLRGYPNALAALLWSRLPAFVLDIFHGSGSVGLFSVAQQVLEQLILPVQATQDAIYRDVARLPRPSATLAMNRYLRTGLWAMLPLVVACAALAPWIVPLIFGDAFAASARVFQILLISLLASVVPALLSPYFFGQLQRPGLASSVAWARVLLALALSLALAPGLAEVGVATALAIADVCSTLLILMLYVRIAATPVAQAILPQVSDFGSVLRRFSRA
ncbi:MAG TPA: oligosaccharide flippase family protein [Chloroflexota bacterium]